LAMINHDFKNHQTNLNLRAWQDFISGWKAVAETVVSKDKDLSVRCGIGKNGVQFSVHFNNAPQSPAQVGMTVSTYLARSQIVHRR
jgi:hypothetical protein